MLGRMIGFVVLAHLPIGIGHAQRATVYYDHRPGTGTAEGRLEYVRSGDLATARRSGLPPRLEVPQGEQVCFRIENANPLLYLYSLTAKPIVATESVEVTELVALLAKMMPIMPKAKAAPYTSLGIPMARRDPGPSLREYQEMVGAIAANLRMIQLAKLSSDRQSLEVAKQEIDSLIEGAREENKRAEEALRTLDTNDQVGTQLATQLRISIMEQIESLAREVESAWTQRTNPICSDKVDGKALSITLAIRSRADSGFKPARPVGDAVAIIEGTPSDQRRYMVSAGGMASSLIAGQRQFGVVDGVVTESQDRAVRFLPMAYISGRATSDSWLWGTIGTSVDDEGVQGLFFGLTGQFGVAIIGPSMSLGVGLSLARVTTGLNKGTVGAPLPDGIESVDAITSSALRPGLGVTFTITGLSIGKS